MVSLPEAVATGRLEGLRSLRDVLAAAVVDAGESQTASLARQLRECLREIAELERAVPKGSVVDDLASRRKTRGAVAEGVGGAVGGGQE